jgi:hypothetical protein
MEKTVLTQLPMVNSPSKCLTDEMTAGIPAAVVLGAPMVIFSFSMGGVGEIGFFIFDILDALFLDADLV